MSLKPLTTEKAVMLIEKENVLTFETSRNMTKEILKKEEKMIASYVVILLEMSLANWVSRCALLSN